MARNYNLNLKGLNPEDLEFLNQYFNNIYRAQNFSEVPTFIVPSPTSSNAITFNSQLQIEFPTQNTSNSPLSGRASNLNRERISASVTQLFHGYHILNTDVVETSLAVAGSARGHTERRSAFLQIFELTLANFAMFYKIVDTCLITYKILSIRPFNTSIVFLINTILNFLPYTQTSYSFRLIILVEETI